MELKCKCRHKCIKNAHEILSRIQHIHHPCPLCYPLKIKKFTPLAQQFDLNLIDGQFGRCKCKKRHIDAIMAHVLKIMIDDGLYNEEITLRKSVVPLITPAYQLKNDPYLKSDSLIILASEMNSECAERVYHEVKEVKGVLKGDVNKTVGMKDSASNPHSYRLLAGCDIRCDIFGTPHGPICIHKAQSEIHIEVPRFRSPKISSLHFFLKKNYLNSDFKVLDATCGPGTLGIFSLKAGAKKVVFNDIWKPATIMTAFNLESNGFEVQIFDEKAEKNWVASGKSFEIYNQDIRELNSILDENFDLCVIDLFPGVDPKEFIEATSDLAKKTIVV